MVAVPCKVERQRSSSVLEQYSTVSTLDVLEHHTHMLLSVTTHHRQTTVSRSLSSCHLHQGRNFVPKSGGTNFRFVQKLGGVDQASGAEGAEGVECGEGIFITYCRKGAFWWIPDAFWRANFEVVVCCAQDAARLCDRFGKFFSDRLQFMALSSPIAW